MSGFCICLFKNEWKWCFFFFSFSRSLSVRKNAHTVLVYRDDTHNIIDCLNNRAYLLLSKTLIEINILYFSLISKHFNVCNNDFIQTSK